MEQLSSRNRPFIARGAARSDVGHLIAALIVPWGSGVGMMVGVLIGIFAGRLVQNALGGGQSEIPLMGCVAGGLAGLFLGFLTASVDSLFLARAVPAVLSGRTQACTAAAIASGVAVLAATGLVLLLIAVVSRGALGHLWVFAPAVFLVTIPWVAVTLVGEDALESTLDLPSD